MTRLALSVAAAACLVVTALAPVALAGNQPSAAMVAPSGCSSVLYSWTNMRKAVAAHIEIRPNGALLTTVDSGRVGANGSFAMPTSVTFVAGQHYTVPRDAKGNARRTHSPPGPRAGGAR